MISSVVLASSVLLLVISAFLDRQSCAGSLMIGIMEEVGTVSTTETDEPAEVLASFPDGARTGVGSGTRPMKRNTNGNQNCSIVLPVFLRFLCFVCFIGQIPGRSTLTTLLLVLGSFALA